VRSIAPRLAALVCVGGLVLLGTAGPDDNLQTLLGVMGLVGAGLLLGLGKVLDVLGYVEEGATDADEPR